MVNKSKPHKFNDIFNGKQNSIELLKGVLEKSMSCNVTVKIL